MFYTKPKKADRLALNQLAVCQRSKFNRSGSQRENPSLSLWFKEYFDKKFNSMKE